MLMPGTALWWIWLNPFICKLFAVQIKFINACENNRVEEKRRITFIRGSLKQHLKCDCTDLGAVVIRGTGLFHRSVHQLAAADG
jgi:hypothetical protein